MQNIKTSIDKMISSKVTLVKVLFRIRDAS